MFCLVISRDLDSPLTNRERSAVNEWLASHKIIHIMRDHPLHFDFILAGMWGFQSVFNRHISRLIFDKLQNATLVNRYVGYGDQPFLLNELWPLVKNDSIIHDSYHCQRFNVTAKPFPTKRPIISGRNLFVGCIRPCSSNQFRIPKCPIQCRPKSQIQWHYC
jgi:hypothetical protein